MSRALFFSYYNLKDINLTKMKTNIYRKGFEFL